MNRSTASILVSPLVVNAGLAGIVAALAALGWQAVQRLPGPFERLLAH